MVLTVAEVEALARVGVSEDVLGLDERFENTADGRTCSLRFEADEVVPLHRFDLPNAPVTAWKARYRMFSDGNPHGISWLGLRREVREEAEADLNMYADLEGKKR